MSSISNLQIAPPVSAQDFDAVRNLMRAFMDWHRDRHHDQLELVFGYFDPVAFEDELANLPTKYAPPHSLLLLAKIDGEAAGCVALRRIGIGNCEMKRMFVNPAFQGKGIGKALASQIINEAKTLGFNKMMLDSGAKQFEAHNLYKKLGFVQVPAYYELPSELKDWLVFMELTLIDADSAASS